MEVAQLESRMDAKDYTHLQSIFVVSLLFNYSFKKY